VPDGGDASKHSSPERAATSVRASDDKTSNTTAINSCGFANLLHADFSEKHRMYSVYLSAGADVLKHSSPERAATSVRASDDKTSNTTEPRQ